MDKMTLKEILNANSTPELTISSSVLVDEAVVLNQSRTLMSHGSQLQFCDESSTIQLVGHGPFRFRGFVFRHEAELGPNFVCCDDASVVFEECTFEGAYGGAEEALSVAVKARGRSRVSFERCHFQNNDVHLQAENTANLEIRLCLFQNSRADGIRLFGESQFWGKEIEVTGSGWSGLCAAGTSTAKLLNSVFQENGCHGAEFGQNSRYDGYHNVFEQNAYHGLCLLDNSAASSQGDQSQENGICGLDLSGQSWATLQEFQMNHNQDHGIQFREWSRGSFRACTSYSNLKSGLALYGESGLDAEDFSSESNGLNGIQCSDRTHLRLLRAQVGLNRSSGLTCFGQSRLVAERCRFNDCGGHGVQIAEQCQALLRDCEVMENSRSAVVFGGSSRGVVETCTLAHNKVDGLVTADRCKVTAIENLIRCNARDGVLVLSCCPGQFLENHVQNNDRHGIYAGPGARPLLSDNHYEGNVEEQALLETELARLADRQAPSVEESSTELPSGVTLSVEGAEDLHLPFQPKQVEKTLLVALAKHGRLSEAALGKVAQTRRVGGAMENLIDRLNRAGMPLIRHDGDGPEGNIYALRLDTSRDRNPPHDRTESTPAQGREIC
jgi:Right handed beta helix region